MSNKKHGKCQEPGKNMLRFVRVILMTFFDRRSNTSRSASSVLPGARITLRASEHSDTGELETPHELVRMGEQRVAFPLKRELALKYHRLSGGETKDHNQIV